MLSYSNASDYVRDLIRRDQERAGKLAELQALTTEGIGHGLPVSACDLCSFHDADGYDNVTGP
jgi:Arc/MetJ-type ribon-helix-helix transcriptional regulator